MRSEINCQLPETDRFYFQRFESDRTPRSRRGGDTAASPGDSQVFKRYSQMKLQMKREALEKINRQANEMPLDSGTAMFSEIYLAQFWHSWRHLRRAHLLVRKR